MARSELNQLPSPQHNSDQNPTTSHCLTNLELAATGLDWPGTEGQQAPQTRHGLGWRGLDEIGPQVEVVSRSMPVLIAMLYKNSEQLSTCRC